MKATSLFILLLSIGSSIAFIPQQRVFHKNQDNIMIHGRYLHLTDIHRDKHYLTDATISSNCHRVPNKHKHRKKREGLLADYWGTPETPCDSPKKLVRHNIEYIADQWKDKIDFIIWTGDNARHDSDDEIPRTKKEIIGANVKTTKMLKKAFTFDNRTLPIIPVIGNNDVHPHNALRDMKDNPQLIEFSKMWKDFIPEDQIQEFRRGGYYTVDVIPGIRVIALNTLYFFSSNDVVNGCSDLKSPGARHIRWLRKQLKHAKREQLKVIIIGHVPPTDKTFKDSCLDDYIKLSVKYSDIITGHMYGHTNMDHFQIISREFTNTVSTQDNNSDDNDRFIASLRIQYKHVKKARNRNELVVVHVAPPMLPLFYPTFRINEYETNRTSDTFGNWLKYTQWFSNLTISNEHKKHSPPKFEIEYSTDETYNMTDLTVESWLQFAEKISIKRSSLWKLYLDHMFVKTNNDWYGQSIPATNDNQWPILLENY